MTVTVNGGGVYSMYFLKLNVISMLYAALLFISIELMLNIYRISRQTMWEINTVIFFQ